MSSNYDFKDISIFGSDDFSDDPIREADAQFEEYIIRKARELKICKLHQGMPEGPTDGNGRTVVTTATAVLEDGREITKLDCIDGEKRGIQDMERLILESAMRATIKAIELVQHLSVAHPVVETAPVASRFVPAVAPQEQKVYNHRHDKDISSKQLETIRDMARKKRLHPESYVKENMGGRELSKLNSAEANEVIQALMKVKTFKN